MKHTKLIYLDSKSNALVIYNVEQNNEDFILKGAFITEEKITPVRVSQFKFDIKKWMENASWKEIRKKNNSTLYSFMDVNKKKVDVEIINSADEKTHRAVIKSTGETIISYDNVPVIIIIVGIAAILCAGSIALQHLRCKSICGEKGVKEIDIDFSIGLTGVKCNAKCICN